MVDVARDPYHPLLGCAVLLVDSGSILVQLVVRRNATVDRVYGLRALRYRHGANNLVLLHLVDGSWMVATESTG